MIARESLIYRTLVAMARQGPGLDESRCHAVLDLMATTDMLRRAVHHSAALLGVSELQFGVMMVLLALDPQPCTPALLADHTCVSRSAITEALDRIEERHWITRQRSHEDRRTCLIGLTESGRFEIEQLAPSLLRQLGELAGALSDEASGRLRQLCVCLGDSIVNKLSKIPDAKP